MRISKRKEVIKIGVELGTLTQEDIDFIMDPENNETAIRRRLTTARHRQMKKESGFI